MFKFPRSCVTLPIYLCGYILCKFFSVIPGCQSRNCSIWELTLIPEIQHMSHCQFRATLPIHQILLPSALDQSRSSLFTALCLALQDSSGTFYCLQELGYSVIEFSIGYRFSFSVFFNEILCSIDCLRSITDQLSIDDSK